MGNGGWDALAQREGIAADKVTTLAVRVEDGVEHVGRRVGAEVVDVLRDGIDQSPLAIDGRVDIVVDGEDVLLLGDEEAKVADGGVLQGDDVVIGAQGLHDALTVVKLVVHPVRDLDRRPRLVL
eukprot:224993_1